MDAIGLTYEYQPINSRHHTGIGPDTRKEAIFTTGIGRDTRKRAVFTTGIQADTRETLVFATGLRGITGVAEMIISAWFRPGL
ncbi:hypothetical protein [Mucilaginibacter sp. UR6-11]|uniref:hypothetical protein n=1 Tax=Mucilaginibacter sp. UR6-11 TaxID=1435644 RepID=UPI001E44532B|nr:hypothetical protein [Mucilaginibacter sp. UR6-11]MCC8425447.1 hypothetical protein [Mucilaginibacter sp. UR6-11]